MKKKNLLVAGIMILSMCLMNQLVNAQTCPANKILMSRGCGCSGCQSKCVNPKQVDQLLKKDWYLGPCSGECCNLKAVNTTTTSNNKFVNEVKTNPDTISVVKVSSSSVAPKCNCNCSLPNYGLSSSQLKNCLSYCYRICELGW